MTEEELAQIEARAKAATPGPWNVSYDAAIMSVDEWYVTEACRGIPGYPKWVNADFIASAREDIPALIAALREAWKERERLSGVIERDRTKTAESIAALRGIVAGRSWLGEGRGNLAWDDDQYQEEFRGMIDELIAALDPLKVLAADWSDCPKDFQAARIDWKVRAEAAEAERDTALADLALSRFENGQMQKALVDVCAERDSYQKALVGVSKLEGPDDGQKEP